MFSADEPSKKKFDETVAAVEKRLAALGAAASAVATGIGFSVKKISENLGELWYAAQAAQSSAKDMNAFGYAIEQAGGKAGEGAAELKTFTDYVKSTAGQGAFANCFKVPFDVAHPVNSLMVAIDQLSAQWAKGGAAQATAIQRAQLMGISPDELIPDRVAKMHKAFDAKLKETGFIDDLSKKSAKLNADFNAITTHLKEMAEQASGPLMSAMSGLLEKTDAWLVKNKDWLVAIGTTQAEGIVKGINDSWEEYEKIVSGLKVIIDKINQAVGTATTGGFKGLIAAFQALEPLAKRVGDAMHAALEWAMKPLQVIIDALRSMGLVSPAEASTGGSAGDLGGGTGGDLAGAGKPAYSGGTGPHRGQKSLLHGWVSPPVAPGAMGNPILDAIDAATPGDPKTRQTLRNIYASESAHGGHWDVGDVNDGGAYSPFQFNMGAGRMGDKFYRATGKDPRDPKNLQAITDYAAKYVREHPGADLTKVWQGLSHPERFGNLIGGYPPGMAAKPAAITNPLAGLRKLPADFHKALDAIRAKPAAPWHQSMNHHDHRVVNSNVAVNVKGGFQVDKTERPLERPKMASFIRNTTAFAS